MFSFFTDCIEQINILLIDYCANITPTMIPATPITLTPSQCSRPIAVLGALLGLSVVLLAVVITGWVWTCCFMKKKERVKKRPVQNRSGTTSAIAFRKVSFKCFTLGQLWYSISMDGEEERYFTGFNGRGELCDPPPPPRYKILS